MIAPTEYRVSVKSHEQIQIEILTEINLIADRVLVMVEKAGKSHEKYMIEKGNS